MLRNRAAWATGQPTPFSSLGLRLMAWSPRQLLGIMVRLRVSGCYASKNYMSRLPTPQPRPIPRCQALPPRLRLHSKYAFRRFSPLSGTKNPCCLLTFVRFWQATPFDTCRLSIHPLYRFRSTLAARESVPGSLSTVATRDMHTFPMAKPEDLTTGQQFPSESTVSETQGTLGP